MASNVRRRANSKEGPGFVSCINTRICFKTFIYSMFRLFARISSAVEAIDGCWFPKALELRVSSLFMTFFSVIRRSPNCERLLHIARQLIEPDTRISLLCEVTYFD